MRKTDSLENALNEESFIFLDTNRIDRENKNSFLFSYPEKIIKTSNPKSIKRKIKEIQKEIDKGRYAAGFFSYEASYSLEKSLQSNKKYDFPLLWFGIFNKQEIVKENIFSQKNITKKNFEIKNIKDEISKKDFGKSFKEIIKKIKKGETFETNFTFKIFFDFFGNPINLYKELRKKQKVSFGSIIKFDNYFVLSLSPELFFRIKKNKITAKPMKGTLERGINKEDDEKKYKQLKTSSKDKAENSMIVDLIRSDLGKISKPGTVKTEKLFDVEKYETLYQMTSEIKGVLKENTDIEQIISSIFPSGSITGAPKIRTMEIIKKLEKSPRKIYCGAIGYFHKQESCFSIPIRTILLEKNNNSFKGEMGIGSGIVIDSDEEKEYLECKLKSNFLMKLNPDFSILEAILFKEGKYQYLDLHLSRLKISCDFFGFTFDKVKIKEELNTFAKKLNKRKFYKIRLLLGEDEKISLESLEIKDQKLEKVKNPVAISKKKVDSRNLFLYHKTTNRKLYDDEFEKFSKKGFANVIFLNERNELSEAANANIFIEKNRKLFTPHLQSGLLPGTLRERLINKGKCKEKTLFLKNLKNAEKIYLGNSIRGLQEVKVFFGKM